MRSIVNDYITRTRSISSLISYFVSEKWLFLDVWFWFGLVCFGCSPLFLSSTPNPLSWCHLIMNMHQNPEVEFNFQTIPLLMCTTRRDIRNGDEIGWEVSWGDAGVRDKPTNEWKMKTEKETHRRIEFFGFSVEELKEIIQHNKIMRWSLGRSVFWSDGWVSAGWCPLLPFSQHSPSRPVCTYAKQFVSIFIEN